MRISQLRKDATEATWSDRHLSALLALVLFLAALLPPGMMPGRTDAGVMSVVLCTAQGLRTVYLDTAGREIPPTALPAKDQDHDEARKLLCLFGTGLAAVLGVDASALATPGELQKINAQAFREFLLARAAPLPLGARAPPRPLQI
ncbi:DUF2946 family protein [Roseibium sp.]|uniref:DUF2946 family protein n=1 Tax=Roseibium sp. TaxID=1936156 RepID=UPI003A98556C